MQDIVGPNSMIAMISRQINDTISTDPVLDLNLTNGLNNTQLAQIQWGSCALLCAQRFYLSGVPTLTSTADPLFSPDFPTQPEWSFYVSANSGDPFYQFNTAESEELLNRDFESTKSLLNSDNQKRFKDLYDANDYDSIREQFGLKYDKQIELMNGYLNFIHHNWLQQGRHYDNIAMGTLVQKSLNNSYSFIRDTLPLDLTTRFFAEVNEKNNWDCQHYIGKAVTDYSQTMKICL